MVKQDFDKVVFIGPNYHRRRGGIASVLKTYATFIGKDFNFFSSALVQNKHINFLLLPFRLFHFLIYLICYYRRIAIIHIHGASYGSFYRKYMFFLIVKLLRKKVVYHIHGGKYPIFYQNSGFLVKNAVSHMINSCHGLIVLSQEWKEYFEKEFSNQNIYILNNPIIRGTPRPKNFDQKKNLLFLGTINQDKGIFDLIRAIALLENEIKEDIQLIIGGRGEEKKLLQEIEELGVSKIVSFKGWINHMQKSDLYQKSHIMILPSYHEGLPISLLEAMNYELPLIATQIGGIPQILKPSFNGIFIRPGDVHAIKEAILSYVKTPKKIIDHGHNSKQLVEPYYVENVLNKLNKIYSKI
ncbi:hypothetical protein GCM10009117_19090 [Gangjinia marincola]|uniref:Glycosyl transferase family 1 domain-containing protein n=1 Tax=Gangjinia marincola TaxID=578463 RepID=A0ABP3XZ01_9FLAO